MEREILLKMLLKGYSKKEIAKKLNKSEVAIRKKIQKLKKEKILLGFRPIINFKRVNLLYSITGIDVESEKLIDILEKLKSYNEIFSIYLTSGDHTIIIEVIVDDIKELENLHKKISSIDGVKKVCPSILLDIIKV
ncbi:MAG: Lrp/AsnC ligand binding domain-containing protein [Candidatus Aenigmatarchaeota archaeon]